jgi:cytochrome c oxidase cbb3-type subunit I/II
METLDSIQIFYILRSIGGTLYLVGFILCAWNIWKTARSGAAHDESVEVAVIERKRKDGMTWGESIFNDPLAHIFLAMAFVILWFFLPPHADKAALIVSILLGFKVWTAFKANKEGWTNWHERLIENYLPFTVLVFVAVAIGGAVQIIPTLIVNREKNIEGRLQELYTPLELAGRDIYITEGCYNCHSQMIRTLVPEVMRYGRPGVADDYSHLGESLFDHPYQWGSKRTGPDLAREGGPLAAGAEYMRVGIRGNDWHYNHFLNPRAITANSNMPPYPWLFEKNTDIKSIHGRIRAQRKIGVPWPAMTRDEVEGKTLAQAREIAASLKNTVTLPGKPDLTGDALVMELEKKQVIALIAYMQKLGSHREVTKETPGATPLDPDSYRRTSTAPPASPTAANP